VAGLEQQTNKNYTIKSIEYTRPRLIIMIAHLNQIADLKLSILAPVKFRLPIWT